MAKEKKTTAVTSQVVGESEIKPVNQETNQNKENVELIEPVTDERLSGVIDEVTEDVEKQGESETETEAFKIITRSLEELAIDEIIPFILIPDFIIPTQAEHPIIVRTTAGAYCIEGWTLVEKTKSEGKTSILCEVDELGAHSDTEICLQKAGIRSLTRGGESTHSEMMRNTRDLLAMLLSSDENLRIYGHGQRRLGEGFVNNREEDVRYILSLRLGRDKDTINSYINHCEYLSDDAIKVFTDFRAPKRFFDNIRSKKRIEVNKLTSQKLSPARKTKLISKFMINEYKLFLAEEANKSTKKTKVPATNNANQTLTQQSETTPVNDIDEDSDEYITTGTDSDNIEEPITIEVIKTRARNVSRRIVEDFERDITLSEMKRRLQEEIDAITALLNQIDFLVNREEEQD